MNLFSLLFGGPRASAVCGGGGLLVPDRPLLFDEVQAAIDLASIAPREPSDDGARTFVLSPSFGGAFVFTREEADRRIRLAFPELADALVTRAVCYLESRVRLRENPLPASRPKGYVNDWREWN